MTDLSPRMQEYTDKILIPALTEIQKAGIHVGLYNSGGGTMVITIYRSKDDLEKENYCAMLGHEGETWGMDMYDSEGEYTESIEFSEANMINQIKKSLGLD